MSHEPQLLPDLTLFIQMGIFFACYFVMRALVFKPYLGLLRAREALTSGLKAKALQARERADELHAKYEAFMKEERKKLAVWVDEERRKVNEADRKVVQAARDESAGKLQELRRQIHADYENSRRELLPLVAEYSSHIASKLVGRKLEVSSEFAGSVSHPHGNEQAVTR